MILSRYYRSVYMDKETHNQNFLHCDKVDKDALRDAMNNVLGEADRKGDSWQHINEVIESSYKTYPRLKEYEAERFKKSLPKR